MKIATSAAILALLARAEAAPTSISAAGFAGASTADVFPPAGSKYSFFPQGAYTKKY
jgi:hypothetical protein